MSSSDIALTVPPLARGEGWTKEVRSGQTYWYNTVTRETRWTDPSQEAAVELTPWLSSTTQHAATGNVIQRNDDNHHKWRSRLSELVDHLCFEVFIFLVISVNLVSIAMEDPLASQLTEHGQIINITCMMLFTLEMVLKFIAYGIGNYFANVWNRLDFFVVFFGLLDFIPGFPANLSVIRTIRVLRPLRLVRFFSTY